MNTQCAFCMIPEIKAREIVGNELAWAFPTNIPITPGHTLISPRRCVATFGELTTEERQAILELADKVMLALKKAYKAEGFNVVWNEGKLAGQLVPHFHLHIIPRKEDDTGLLGYDPRSMLSDRRPRTDGRERAFKGLRLDQVGARVMSLKSHETSHQPQTNGGTKMPLFFFA